MLLARTGKQTQLFLYSAGPDQTCLPLEGGNYRRFVFLFCSSRFGEREERVTTGKYIRHQWTPSAFTRPEVQARCKNNASTLRREATHSIIFNSRIREPAEFDQANYNKAKSQPSQIKCATINEKLGKSVNRPPSTEPWTVPNRFRFTIPAEATGCMLDFASRFPQRPLDAWKLRKAMGGHLRRV